jgi:hypothetical protein
MLAVTLQARRERDDEDGVDGSNPHLHRSQLEGKDGRRGPRGRLGRGGGRKVEVMAIEVLLCRGGADDGINAKGPSARTRTGEGKGSPFEPRENGNGPEREKVETTTTERLE